MAVPELRSEVLGLCDILQAILAFNYQYPLESRQILDAIRRDTPAAPARWLRERRDVLRAEIKDQVRRFGLKENPSKFAKGFKENSRTELGIGMLPKFIIDKMFTNYTDKLIDWPSYPPHVLVYLDFSAESHRPKKFDWILAEASLYENMCLAYNFALDNTKLASAVTVPAPAQKVLEFCIRSAVLNAFYFVEAYLNGIAFDFWVRHGETMNERDAETLLEWSSKGNRESFLSFEKKLYTYPRIILSVQHAPLNEGNSPEFKLLVTKAKEIRDAIVHQSPKIDFETGFLGLKLTSFLHLRIRDAAEIVDASVSLVRKLNSLLGKDGIKLDWLIGRDSSGRFPEQAFL